MAATVRTLAAARSHVLSRAGGASAQATSASVSTAARTSLPASDSASRRSRRGVRSSIPVCRVTISPRVRRCQKPARQRFLARAGSRDGEQLEERRRSEQIEIVGVEMIRIAEALTVFTAAGPAILDARKAAVVERDRARRCVARPDDGVVLHDQRDERDDGKRRPPRSDPSSPRRRQPGEWPSRRLRGGRSSVARRRATAARASRAGRRDVRDTRPPARGASRDYPASERANSRVSLGSAR